MNKTELIDAIAAAADLPKASAGRALDAVVESRNPQTGATIEMSASEVPSFKAGKALKDAVNS